LKKCTSLFIVILLSILTGMINSCSHPEDGKGAYKTGRYRNLFLENGHTQEEVDAKVEEAFQQFFNGNSAQVIYCETGANDNGKLAMAIGT